MMDNNDELLEYNKKIMSHIWQQMQIRLEKVDYMCTMLFTANKKLAKNKDYTDVLEVYDKIIKDIDNKAESEMRKFNALHEGE